MIVRNWDSPSLVHSFRYRSAVPSDGASLWRLVQAAGTLELNSAYFYLLFATDFGRTCLIAEEAGEVVGAVIGYHPPEQADTAFVWQVGLLPRLQGQGLGVWLLQRWIALPANRSCRWVTATVADDNAASQALFRRFAQQSNTQCHVQAHFTADLFPVGHPPEPLYRVGPIERTVSPTETEGEPEAPEAPQLATATAPAAGATNPI
jgi:L-2,4-diaminobutyric acid acetyltransferase